MSLNAIYMYMSICITCFIINHTIEPHDRETLGGSKWEG